MPGDTLHIYVHWPFCRSKCPYCDFNSHVGRADETDEDHGRWHRAVIRELQTFATNPSVADTAGRTIGSIFFGGGTPSLMAPAHVAAIVETAKALWPIADDCEITLEANPTSSEAGRFRGFHAAGVNRLSIGVQSFDDTTLRFLGRTHSAAEARDAVDAAAAVFDRVSFDLIYAIPGQSLADWSRQLAQAVAMPVRHLSVYQLTVAPGTAFDRLGVRPAREDLGSDLFERTLATLDGAGLPAYEISNHAAPGEECRHNVAIWRGADYLPVGPGAEGRLRAGHGCVALSQHRDPQRWLDAVETHGHGLAQRHELTPSERLSELLILGLRLREGLDRSRVSRLAGQALDAILDPEAIGRMIDAELIEVEGDFLCATAAGRQRLDWILPRLLA